MKLAHFYPWLEGAGGVPAYCRLLCDGLAHAGVASAVLCRPGPHKVQSGLVSAHYPAGRLPFMLSDFVELHRFLRRHGSSIDAVVFYGGFSPYNAVAALIARWSGTPYVLSPDGTIAPAVMGHGRRLLKQVYFQLVERRILANAAAIRLLSDFEQRCLQNLRVRTPMFLAREAADPEAVSAARRYARRRSAAQHFLFLGRLDVWQKGLDHLLTGFAASLRENDRGQRLTLVGPPEPGAMAELHEQCRRLELTVGREVTICPPVRGEAKWEIFERSDVFIHPSRNEGIPRSVLEALTFGLPVIITPETNLGTVVQEARAGWCVPGSWEGVCQGIREALSCPDLGAPAEAAAQLASELLRWDVIAADFERGVRTAFTRRRGRP
jgi:glycosyltransferase involved in cell wall biosynthesis